MNGLRVSASLLGLAALSACGTLKDAAFAPQLSPVGAPAPHAGAIPVSLPMPPAPQEERYAANALWRAGGRTFFNDQRAARIGDILTVKIDIADSAQVSNSTNRSRTGSTDMGITNLFGLENPIGRALPGATDTSSLIAAEGASTAQGQGAVNRNERIELTVAAIVSQILPNGNFVIQGRQEVMVNYEVRELTVAGVIRPEDIAADNTIRHSQIAEARISYGGRGVISAVQRPGIGQRVTDAVAPW